MLRHCTLQQLSAAADTNPSSKLETACEALLVRRAALLPLLTELPAGSLLQRLLQQETVTWELCDCIERCLVAKFETELGCEVEAAAANAIRIHHGPSPSRSRL
jgi:hypothetical protein